MNPRFPLLQYAGWELVKTYHLHHQPTARRAGNKNTAAKRYPGPLIGTQQQHNTAAMRIIPPSVETRVSVPYARELPLNEIPSFIHARVSGPDEQGDLKPFQSQKQRADATSSSI